MKPARALAFATLLTTLASLPTLPAAAAAGYSNATARSLPVVAGQWFQHIVIIVFENRGKTESIADVNFAKYAAMGRTLTNYYAVTHPSQPNYIAMVAGDPLNVRSNSNVKLPQTSLFNLMDAAGVTYKGYQEGYSGICNPVAFIKKYARKHNPLISFNYIRSDAARCARIVGAPQFDVDLNAGTLPSWSFFTPNQNNDGHDTNITFAGKWLDSFLAPRLSKFPPKSLVAIVFDEDDRKEGNHVLAILLDPQGDVLTRGVDNTLYSHYSLLRTVEDNWGLGSLGRRDSTASAFTLT